MKRIHWKLGIITVLSTGMGFIVLGDSSFAQGNRGGGGGNRGGGNQGGGIQVGGNQGRGDVGSRGGVNINGGASRPGVPHTGGGFNQNQGSQGIVRPSFGGNPPPNAFRSPSLNQPAIRLPNGNFPNVPNIVNGNNTNGGIRINPNTRGNGSRGNGIANPVTPNSGIGVPPFVGPNSTNRTVYRPPIGNAGNVGNRFYNGNTPNAGVGFYQPAYTRHAGYHGYWNSNRGLLGGFGYNSGLYGGLGTGFGGGYGIANGNWGYGNSFGNSYGSGYGGYGYRPLGWGLGGWGLGSLIYNSGYLGYSNPYYVNSGTSVYNYSQPIPVTYNVASSETTNSNFSSAEQIFSDAVAAFRRKEFDAALELTNSGITQFPDDAVLHELRALIYFARGDYLEAAGTIHSVLAVGPGWDWTTLVGMYANAEDYTNQLRALETYVRNHPEDAASHFLLAYQYMSCGHADVAAKYLDIVVRLVPTDRVAIDLRAMLSSAVSDSPDSSGPATPTEPLGSELPKRDVLSFQSDAIIGTWHAARDKTSNFVLTLDKESHFTWNFTPQGQDAQSFQGNYTLENDVLSLNRDEGGSLVATLSKVNDKQFNFKLIGAPKEDPGLTFEK